MRKHRGISFEDVIAVLHTERVLDTLDNPNKKRYGNQYMYIIILNEYVYSVPFVEDEGKIFLKTIYPTRKYKKKYLKGGKYEKEKV